MHKVLIFYDFILTGKYKNVRRAKVQIYSGGVGYAKGLSVGAFGMNSVTFEDGLSKIEPDVFNGDWVDKGIALSAVKGISVGNTHIGKTLSVGWYSWITTGYLASAGVTGGEVRVTSQRFESCRNYTCDDTCKVEIKRRTEEAKKYPK